MHPSISYTINAMYRFCKTKEIHCHKSDIFHKKHTNSTRLESIRL